MTTVSGSLDEEDADDITKGFTVSIEEVERDQLAICLTVTDGFDVTFQHQVSVSRLRGSNHYRLGPDTLVAFVLDGDNQFSGKLFPNEISCACTSGINEQACGDDTYE